MADEPVIIVDANGDEHEFPAGMDPKKAALIVREHTTGVPISSNEPDTYLGGFFKGGMEGMVGGAKGFFRGLGPGLKSIVTETPKQLLGAGLSAAKGVVNLVNDPQKTLTEAFSGSQEALSKIPQLIQQASDLAATDPEAFGKVVGELTGNAEGMMMLARFVPLLPKPVALKVGESLHRVGKAGEFAAYLTGAHQIAGGDPKGVVTIALPGIMRAASKPLIKFGTNMSELPIAEQIKMQPEGSSGVNKLPLYEQMNQLPVPEPEPLPNLKRGPNPPMREPVSRVEPVSTLDRSARAQLKRQGYSDEMIAKIEAASTRPSTTAPPKGRMEQQLAELAPEPTVTAPAEAPLLSGQGPGGLPLAAQELASEGSQRYMHSQYERNKGSQIPQTVDPAAVDAAHQRYLDAVAPDNPEMVQQARTNALEDATPIPEDFSAEGAANYDPSNPPPGPSAGGSLGAFEQGLLDTAGTPPSSPATKRPITEVPPTRSKRGPMSATPGLTVADVEGIGLNPSLRIKNLTPDMIEAIKKNRAARAVSHRTNAGLNKGFERALLEDLP